MVDAVGATTLRTSASPPTPTSRESAPTEAHSVRCPHQRPCRLSRAAASLPSTPPPHESRVRAVVYRHSTLPLIREAYRPGQYPARLKDLVMRAISRHVEVMER